MNTRPPSASGASNSHPRRVAVIGAGLAGLSCARRLTESGHSVTVFDKSHGPSGRAATRNGDGWSCDHGAQYFTAQTPDFAAEVTRWCEAGVCAPWDPRLRVFGTAPDGASAGRSPQRYVGAPSMTAPARWLARGLDLRLRQTIDAMRADGHRWNLRSAEHGWHAEAFDAVLLALPAAQARALLDDTHPELAACAEPDAMQPCWCVMAVFDRDPFPGFDAAFVNQDTLAWICADHRKPGRSGSSSWVLHAQPQWSQTHLDTAPAQVADQMLQAFQALGAESRPRLVTAHRWRWARGALADPVVMCWDPKAGLGLCGDWMCGGRIEGAWRSGRALAEALCTDGPTLPSGNGEIAARSLP